MCSIEDCQKPLHAKGLCKRHYQQQWATGSPIIHRPNPWGTPEERFWRYVEKHEESCCWLWNGNKDKDGYGVLQLNGKSHIRAHRFSYATFSGEIPEGLFVLHTCNNTSCVNPSHLYVGNHKDNMAYCVLSKRTLKGERNPNAKFTDAVVAMIRESTKTNAEISKEFNISRAHVYSIRRGEYRN